MARMRKRARPVRARACTCCTCGMLVTPREYHPFAACLMYRGCRDADTVRANLQPLPPHAPAKRSKGAKKK